MMCPSCYQQDTFPIRWEPPAGLDPTLKKYHCSQCGVDFYVARRLKEDEEIEPTQPMLSN